MLRWFLYLIPSNTNNSKNLFKYRFDPSSRHTDSTDSFETHINPYSLSLYLSIYLSVYITMVGRLLLSVFSTTTPSYSKPVSNFNEEVIPQSPSVQCHTQDNVKFNSTIQRFVQWIIVRSAYYSLCVCVCVCVTGTVYVGDFSLYGTLLSWSALQINSV